MGTFNTTVLLHASSSFIPAIAVCICRVFENDGYEVMRENVTEGGIDISITRQSIFKSVLGKKTALKITLLPKDDEIEINAGIGIFGYQTIPNVIILYAAWPILITHLWAFVKQSHLDDRAIITARSVINELSGYNSEYPSPPPPPPAIPDAPHVRFCKNCGARLSRDAHYCSNCSKKLS